MASGAGDEFYNCVGGDRIRSRQIDELIGIARGNVALRRDDCPKFFQRLRTDDFVPGMLFKKPREIIDPSFSNPLRKA